MSADDLVKILLAIAVGGAIGLEREFRDKAAGFRTLIFICLGSTLFTMLSQTLGAADNGDPTRIASNIVAGVGFLGAGVILRKGGHVVGLTTAASVWLVAALGMGIGAGRYALTLTVTAVTLFVLLVFPFVERWIDRSDRGR
jgi:putative Mg2+ transporter-C (MgtC) family protein